MLTLSPPARGFAILLLIALLSLGAASAHAGPAPADPQSTRHQLLPPEQDPSAGGEPDIISPVQDSDGDGIPNIQDPDDDNGGVSDQEDPAPFDPVIEPTPPSDPLSPVHDDDGDGIPNIQDPDDDNDGISDDQDPGEPDPVVDPGTGGASGDNSGGQAAVGGGGTPLVTGLPSTGTGPGIAPGIGIHLVVAGTAGIVLALSLRLRGRPSA